jgi:hypothetical protein
VRDDLLHCSKLALRYLEADLREIVSSNSLMKNKRPVRGTLDPLARSSCEELAALIVRLKKAIRRRCPGDTIVRDNSYVRYVNQKRNQWIAIPKRKPT